MASKNLKMVTKEEFLKNRQMYTTEVTVTVKCRVTTDATSEEEAIKWSLASVKGEAESADIGDDTRIRSALAKVVKARKFTKKELKELLDNSRMIDENGNEVYCL